VCRYASLAHGKIGVCSLIGDLSYALCRSTYRCYTVEPPHNLLGVISLSLRLYTGQALQDNSTAVAQARAKPSGTG
jgi:hypothetical protein